VSEERGVKRDVMRALVSNGVVEHRPQIVEGNIRAGRSMPLRRRRRRGADEAGSSPEDWTEEGSPSAIFKRLNAQKKAGLMKNGRDIEGKIFMW